MVLGQIDFDFWILT